MVCEHCNGEIEDGKIFNIKGFDNEYRVCGDCIEDLPEQLDVMPFPYPCFMEAPGPHGIRIFLQSKEELDQYLDEIKKEQTDLEEALKFRKFGFIKAKSLTQREIDAIYGTNGCGGSNDEEIDRIIKTVTEKCFGKSRKSDATASGAIIWRGNKSKLNYKLGIRKEDSLAQNIETNQILVKGTIQDHIRIHGLEGIPYLLTTKKNMAFAMNFCFPLLDKRLIYVENYKALLPALKDPKNALSDSDIVWLPTTKFIDYKRDSIRREQKILKRKSEALDLLETQLENKKQKKEPEEAESESQESEPEEEEEESESEIESSEEYLDKSSSESSSSDDD